MATVLSPGRAIYIGGNTWHVVVSAHEESEQQEGGIIGRVGERVADVYASTPIEVMERAEKIAEALA